MIATFLTELAVGATLASADDGGSPAFLLILGPAGGVGAYFILWRYYRNTHTSHAFERETRIASQPVSGHDTKVKEIKGTRKSGIDGDNRTDHRRRVKPFGDH